MSHQARKLQNPLKTLKVLQFYRFKTVKDRSIAYRRLRRNERLRKRMEIDFTACRCIPPWRVSLILCETFFKILCSRLLLCADAFMIVGISGKGGE